MNYTFSGKTKILSLILIAIGVIATVYGFIATPERIWSNLLLNTFFFLAIGVAGVFFIAVHTIGEAGWYVAIRRIPEAMGMYVPVGALILLILVVTGLLGLHNNGESHYAIWHWMDPHFKETDAIYNTSGKKVYLDNVFYIIRSVVFLGAWSFFAWKFRQLSLRQDNQINGVAIFKKNIALAATFLVIFAVSSSMSAWDWLMSIDVHWFSTLFGWYIFAGLFVSGLTMMLLITVHMKRLGLMPHVNENHIHDIAKYTFAFSIFWTYLWFSQYMLYWYSNIPEEINYFLERFNTNYRYIVIPMLIINFAFPVVVLMHRYAKRNYGLLTFAGFIILFGHYLDLFQIIMPGTVKDKWCIGFTEIGTFAGFLGLFLFVVLSSLSKASLITANHPFLNESKQHHI